MALFPSESDYNNRKLKPITELECVEEYQKFQQAFPDDGACRRELQRILSGRGLMRCKNCGVHFNELTWGAKAIFCTNCKKWNWPLSHTFFHRMREAMAWLAAIWSMLRGIIMPSAVLSRLTGIAPSSARYINLKVSAVAAELLKRKQRALPTAAFHRIFYKRSRETPKNQHPICEQEGILEILKRYTEGRLFHLRQKIEREIAQSAKPTKRNRSQQAPMEEFGDEDKQIDQIAESLELLGLLESKPHMEVTGEIGLVPADSQALTGVIFPRMLEPEEVRELVAAALSSVPQTADEIAIRSGISISNVHAGLTLAELDGTLKHAPGGRYYIDEPIEASSGQLTDKLSEEDEHVASQVESFIECSYGGSSRKCLQPFATAAGVRLEGKNWDMDMLLTACFEFGVIFHRHLAQRVTGDTVYIAGFG